MVKNTVLTLITGWLLSGCLLGAQPTRDTGSSYGYSSDGSDDGGSSSGGSSSGSDGSSGGSSSGGSSSGGSSSGDGSSGSGDGSSGSDYPSSSVMCDEICDALWPCIWGDLHTSVDCGTCSSWNDPLIECLYDCGGSCSCAENDCGMTVVGG